eukprot:scaffold18.g2020.t1
MGETEASLAPQARDRSPRRGGQAPGAQSARERSKSPRRSPMGSMPMLPTGGPLKKSVSEFFSPGGHPTVVIKVGTSSLIRDNKQTLNLTSIGGIVEVARDLKDAGFNVIVVSSGAVGVGCQRLGLTVRPDNIAQKQALAAVGQVHLMRYYDELFGAVGLTCAQVLLTLDNLANRSQYVNAKNTFEELLRYGVVPIVNENDTELRIGDNDTLAAQVATVVAANWLFLLTDVPNLYTSNPNTDPNAQPIYEVPDLSRLHVDTSTRGTQWGTGGMATKLTAARIATAAGCRMVITHFAHPERIPKIIAGERIGTVFQPVENPARGRKRWILSVPVKGEVWLDGGAVRAVKERKKSLFSAGIVETSGEFCAQDAVRLCDVHGEEFARALINYSADDIEKMKGVSHRQSASQLGYHGPEEVCHRNNICLVVPIHDDSDYDHDHDHEHEHDTMTLDGPSRSITPPVHLSSPEHSGIHNGRPPLPPGMPHVRFEPQGAAYVQQAQQQQPQQHAQQQQQLEPSVSDLAARLAVLQSR